MCPTSLDCGSIRLSRARIRHRNDALIFRALRRRARVRALGGIHDRRHRTAQVYNHEVRDRTTLLGSRLQSSSEKKEPEVRGSEEGMVACTTLPDFSTEVVERAALIVTSVVVSRLALRALSARLIRPSRGATSLSRFLRPKGPRVPALTIQRNYSARSAVTTRNAIT
jgi:hypothetical protein